MKPELEADVLSLPVAVVDAAAILQEQAILNLPAPDPISYQPAKKLVAPHDTAVEVVEKRTTFSKTYQLDENSFQVVVDKSMVHFQNDGAWEEINLLIRDVKGKKVMTNAPYKVELFTDRIGYRLLQPDGTFFTIELVAIAGNTVDNATLTTKVDGCQMFYDGLLPNMHHKILLRSDKPEIFTMLDDASAPRTFTWLVTNTGSFDFSTTGVDDNGDAMEMIVANETVDDNSFTYTETWTGNVSRIANKKTRVKTLFDDPAYPVVIDPSVNISVSANADDGRQQGNVWDSANMTHVGMSSHVLPAGMRFQSVGVPTTGATITSAFLKPQVKSVSSGLTGKIAGNKVGNAAVWATGGSRPNTMTPTTSKPTWTPTVGVNSIPITAAVAEIVALGSWAYNNAMKFGFISITPTYHYAFIYDHNTTPAKSAQLVINYTTGGGGAVDVPVPPQIVIFG